MKALVMHRYGGPDVARIGEVAQPSLAAGQGFPFAQIKHASAYLEAGTPKARWWCAGTERL